MKYCSKCGAEVSERFCPKCGNDCKPTTPENLKETVNQLYALRAGISAISIENDTARKDIGKSENILGNVEKKKEDINKKMIEFSNELDNYKKTIDGCSVEARQKAEIALKKAKAKIKFWKIFHSTIIITFIISVVTFVILSFRGCMMASRNEDVSLIDAFLFVTIGIGILCVILLFITTTIMGVSSTYKEENELERQDKGLKTIPKISQTEMSINIAKDDLKDKKQTILLLKEEVSEKRIYYSAVGNTMYNALVNQFSNMLDPRDWQHLDLVIFYIESGRAETMKEALQQVDRQVQTDSIINAIEIASSQICTTIRRGVQHLQNTIVGCAKVLSIQLESILVQQNQISSKLSSMNSLLSAQSMQKALATKADVSSKQLMEDVHQMRIYAENAEIKRRNS